jgi:hypothetical protein
MPDELDPILEARLRAALRSEADALPLTLRAADLRRVEVARSRGRRSLRFGLVAAAAAIVVVLGGAGILANVRPQGNAAASPSASVAARPLATYAELEARLATWGPPDPLLPALRGEHLTADSGEVPLTATLGTINGARVLGDCVGGSITIGIRSPGGSLQSQDWDCGDEPFVMGIGEIGDLFVTALPSVRWRVVAGDLEATEASPQPSAAGFVLDSFAELERALLEGTNRQQILGRAELTDPVDVTGVLTTTIATIPATQFLNVALSCSGGDFGIYVLPAGIDAARTDQRMFGLESQCSDHSRLITDGNTYDAPVEVVIQTTGPVAWRTVVGGWPPASARPTAPPPAGRQEGETRLVQIDVQAGAPEKERTATIPAGTDVLYLTAPCAGEGTLEIEIDGVAASYACGAIGIETFIPDASNQLIVRAGATGTAAFAVRVGAVDWEAARPGAWRPPTLRLSGPDQTAGDIVTLTAFPGCGWSWQPRDGGGSSTDCGPSWQPMAARLSQDPGTQVILRLGGGWTITDIAVDIARNQDILASGRAPSSQPWTVRAAGNEPFVMDVPSPGDWGVRLLVSGERNGDRFQVPYYARIVVAGP